MELQGKKVLIVGGGGFLGSHLVEGYQKKGAEVRVLDTFISSYKDNLADLGGGIELIDGDVNQYEQVYSAARGVDVLVHTAFPMAHCDRSPSNQHIPTGVVGLYNSLRSAYEQGCKLIYASSISVYGTQQYVPIDENHPLQPLLLYGATKLAGEYYCQVMHNTYGLPVVILRYSDLYGPRNGRLSAPMAFLLNCLEGDPIVVQGGGSQRRSYTYITDAVQGTILATSNEEAVGHIINIAGDDCISVYDLAHLAQDIAGNEVGVIVLEEEEEDGRQYQIDNKKGKMLLGFQPQVNIKEGLNLTWKWLRDNKHRYR